MEEDLVQSIVNMVFFVRGTSSFSIDNAQPRSPPLVSLAASHEKAVNITMKRMMAIQKQILFHTMFQRSATTMTWTFSGSSENSSSDGNR
jgi:hypothetical protein